MYTEYEIDAPYPRPDDQPSGDATGLCLEGVPIFKLWCAAPVRVERACLAGKCTHIGLVPPPTFPGGLPLFKFRGAAGQSLLVRAPLAATQAQVEEWASADSDAFIFLLIERGPAIVRQIRTIGVPPEFRARLVEAWLSVKHPVNMQSCQSLLAALSDEEVMSAAILWGRNPVTGTFQQK
jgi:hypothetical protein